MVTDDAILALRVSVSATLNNVLLFIERHELDHQRLKLVADRATSKAEMKKKLGQLLYLENLKVSLNFCRICLSKYTCTLAD